MTDHWRRQADPPTGFDSRLGLSELHARLLYNRGIRQPQEVEPFLSADRRSAHDPMLLPDMDVAVDRLRAAIDTGETVAVFGDVDTDGVTGTALLANALGELGATVVTYLPDRVEEGHGLNEAAIRRLREQAVSLIITVDCGVGSEDEIILGASLGMDTVVTDHHAMIAGPSSAVATINPRRPDSEYPYPDLTGAGMAFKLAEALYSAAGRQRPEHLMELAALGTVADVGPLTGENRHIVKRGLERLNATRSPGILALMGRTSLKPGSVDTGSLSFKIIPRLNSAGRLGDARTSLDLLTAKSTEVAEPLAARLERDNDERRRLTEQGMIEARAQVEAKRTAGGLPTALIVASQDWIPGILGLIAGRLAETYGRPTAAVSLGHEVSRGSARSVPGFDIVGAIGHARDLLVRYGGHPQAAGFTVPTSSLFDLERRLLAASEDHDPGPSRPEAVFEAEVSPSQLSGQTFEFIQSLAPFGEANPDPVFLSRNVRVLERRQVGRKADHLKMRLSDGGKTWDAIAFRQGDKAGGVTREIDLVYTIGLDDWGDRPRLQLQVLDLRPTP
ncbi:MAG: single-stranded-DNA-specific exonuclease RecJ [Candidatus Brocadiia bacterium]|nr:single-stranded-DNA-specific exonuclease RecJ [Candidatus Brocadiia bacterium]